MEEVYLRVAKRVRELRSNRGMTQDQLAEKANISASFLSYLERGGRMGSLVTYDRLAEGLGIPLAELFTEGQAASRYPDGPVIPVGHLTAAQRKSVYHIVRSIERKPAAGSRRSG